VKSADARGGRQRLILVLLLAALIGSGLALAAPADASTAVTIRLRKAISVLPVKAHSHASSYDRDADFGSWITQYGSCDTRAVVLKTESLAPTSQNSNCTVSKGKWYSFYNATYYFNAYGGVVQVDHTVPVENAWVSGAWAWSHATRVRYYNDLTDKRTLVAVDRSDNEAKGASDPSGWMPSHGRCRYVRNWVAVKIRWHLTVTGTEKRKLTSLAASCANTTLKIVRASVS